MRASPQLLAKSILLTTAIAAACAIAFFAGRRTIPPRVENPPETASQANQRKVANAVRAIDRRLAALEAKEADPTQAPEPRERSGGEMTSKQRDELLSQRIQKAAQFVERLDDIARQESRDATWANQYEQSLRQAAQAASLHPETDTLKSVTCGSTLCRIEVSHRNDAHRLDYVSEFRQKVPDVILHFSSPGADSGTLVTLIHVVRKGYPLPRMDEP